MDMTEFWELIDQTRIASDGNPYRQTDLLTDVLAQLPENDILMFDSIVWDLMDKAYVSELWDAAFIIRCGCSDDGFIDFRYWLIGRGRDIFYQAIADPESLVNVIESHETIYPTLLGVSFNAYERVTKQVMPIRARELAQLKGETLEEPLALARFPKLAAKFWKP